MDRAEAIKELTQWRDQMKSHGVPNYGKKLTALDLAIEALVLRDKYIKAVERMIEGAKEINRFLDEAAKKSDEKHQLSGETSTNTSTNEGDAETATTTDCISRADAIAYIDRIINSGLGKNKSLDYIRKYIYALPPVTPTERTGEWIPVSERLPEEYAQYHCYCEGGDCYVYWLENKPWAEETVEKEEIIAWQPLPEPYKGGDME